jgi:hypothetical protein
MSPCVCFERVRPARLVKLAIVSPDPVVFHPLKHRRLHRLAFHYLHVSTHAFTQTFLSNSIMWAATCLRSLRISGPRRFTTGGGGCAAGGGEGDSLGSDHPLVKGVIRSWTHQLSKSIIALSHSRTLGSTISHDRYQQTSTHTPTTTRTQTLHPIWISDLRQHPARKERRKVINRQSTEPVVFWFLEQHQHTSNSQKRPSNARSRA